MQSSILQREKLQSHQNKYGFKSHTSTSQSMVQHSFKPRGLARSCRFFCLSRKLVICNELINEILTSGGRKTKQSCHAMARPADTVSFTPALSIIFAGCLTTARRQYCSWWGRSDMRQNKWLTLWAGSLQWLTLVKYASRVL